MLEDSMKYRLLVLGAMMMSALGISWVTVSAQTPLKAVATFSVLGDVVQNIAGDKVELSVLVGADSDSHTYEPSPSDAIMLNQAQLIFEIGAEFETWLDELYTASESVGTRVVVSENIELLEFAGHEHEGEDHKDEAGHDHEHEHEEITSLQPWAGTFVSGWSFGVDAMQPAFDAILATTPELTLEDILAYYEVGNKTDFDSMTFANDSVTFSTDGDSVTCAYVFVAESDIPQVPGEKWYQFETTDTACAMYRSLLLNPVHAVEEGATPHFHFRYGSADLATVIADNSPWFPSMYPEGTTIDMMMGGWTAGARSVALYIASVQGIDVALTEEEMVMMQATPEGEEHEGEDHEHEGEDHEHEGEDHEHEHGEYDPHIWHDPNAMLIVVENVRLALITADPANEATYTANAQAYSEQLIALDAYIRVEIEKIPMEQRILFTSHDTFGYFGAQYGFVVDSALESVSTEASDPSAADLADLITEIQESGVKAIFAENIANSDLMQRIADDAGVVLASTLYTDALGAEDSMGASYLDMVKYNVDTIVTALSQ
jgi:ABC-type Zn uptake system ZnuABC Zn-binding protein ZnuA